MGERSSLPVSSPKLFFGYWKMEAGVIKSIKYIRLLCWFDVIELFQKLGRPGLGLNWRAHTQVLGPLFVSPEK